MKICSYINCDKAQWAKSFCPGHLRQFNSGKPLKDLFIRRPHGSTMIRNDANEKECINCNRWLDISSFSKNATSLDGKLPYCKKCAVLKPHNITFERFNSLLVKQNGCAVCHIPEEQENNPWVIDHNHDCCPGVKSCGKCIRGVLCRNCNTAEGLLKSNPIVIANLLEYVKNGAI